MASISSQRRRHQSKSRRIWGSHHLSWEFPHVSLRLSHSVILTLVCIDKRRRIQSRLVRKDTNIGKTIRNVEGILYRLSGPCLNIYVVFFLFSTTTTLFGGFCEFSSNNAIRTMTIAISNMLVVFTVNLLAAKSLSKALSTVLKKGFICLRVPL